MHSPLLKRLQALLNLFKLNLLQALLNLFKLLRIMKLHHFHHLKLNLL